ncbi:MAG: 16S rRNA (cytidine(1402)-2'-O)-methyltransferase, partial [Clostridia bacterium]|nr:16S rRNA (cytidine(1402)-2'-O)-methyltransferase [Clostridia bacterium]
MAFEVQKGTLYVVPTPIGNLADMTPRALEVLKDVDFIACEDTRITGKLLSLFDIKNSFVSYHEHNKKKQGNTVLSRLLAGESAAIASDAGTPAISDPGEDLVRKCIKNGVPVVPLPGACAFVTALSASGMDSRRFCFE